MRAHSIAFVLIVHVLCAGCEQQQPATTGANQAAAETATSASTDIEGAQRNQQIVTAVRAGNYQQAIRLAREAKVSKPEADLAIGQLILQGSSDAQARQQPAESVATALALMEEAAAASHEQAIYALAALFNTGLQAGNSGSFLVPANTALSECWEAAKQQRDQVASCIALRGKQ